MIPADGTFLSPDEREEIIRLVTHVINLMGKDGRRNLLLPCKFPDIAIKSIKLDELAHNVAEAMVRTAEAEDEQDPESCYLQNFLTQIIIQGDYLGRYPEKSMKKILTNYSHKRDKNTIINKLQAQRDKPSAPSQTSSYQIDASKIIECNLHEQKEVFRRELAGRYKGVFTFTVASIDRGILMEYVIESLIQELRQHFTERSIALPRHIYLSPERLDYSSPEQGIKSIQKEIEQQYSIESTTDLLFDNQETNVVIVIWPQDIPLKILRPIVHKYSTILKESVKDIMHQQGRCLVLFWAIYGLPSIRPLNGPVTKSPDAPIALPVFRQFEVCRLSEWLEYEISNLLRKHNVPEEYIRRCWEERVSQVKHLGGRLPDTYYKLREPLRSGGTH